MTSFAPSPRRPDRSGARHALAPLLGLSLSACAYLPFGNADDEAAEEEAGAASPDAAGEAAEAGSDGAGAGDPSPGDAAEATGIDRYRSWTPVHASLSATVVLGTPISATEAVVLTRDNHVGVTRDAGSSWHFERLRNGSVSAIDGFAGGPYVAVGPGGYVALSQDGARWQDLPRYTSDDLVAVVASELGIVAVGKRGAFVRYDRDGDDADAGTLPDKFRAAAVMEQSGAVVAYAGRKAYGTVDGTTWTRFESDLELPGGKVALTAAGSCTLGKVGPRKGVVCSVSGTAYGLAKGVAAVEKNGVVALTTNGGDAYDTAALPFKGVNAIFGGKAGPYFAIASGGRIASSKKGATWSEIEWEGSDNLRDGLVDGDRVVVVGDKRTLAVSTNGGKSWTRPELELGGSFTHVAKIDGKYVVTDGKLALSSPDLVAWSEELEQLPELPPRPESCTELPGPGAVCNFASGLTTPEGLPDVRAFRFAGDVGVAWGDDGLTAFTDDGGASWKTEVGLRLDTLRLLDVHDDIVVASDGKGAMVSTDGGATFERVGLAGKPSFEAIHIAEGGIIYAAGKGGTLLRSGADPRVWLPAEREPELAKSKTALVGLFEVGGNMFAAGSKGELWRSDAEGVWSAVDLGRKGVIQAMTGNDDAVLAVTRAARDRGNLLMRSDDGGAHFYVVTEMSHAGAALDFHFDGDTLRYRDRASDDEGLSWRSGVERYWPGAVPLEDGSGRRIVSYADRYGKDPLYIVGDERDDWLLIDAVFAEQATIRCGAKAGCWMLAGGALYHPL